VFGQGRTVIFPIELAIAWRVHRHRGDDPKHEVLHLDAWPHQARIVVIVLDAIHLIVPALTLTDRSAIPFQDRMTYDPHMDQRLEQAPPVGSVVPELLILLEYAPRLPDPVPQGLAAVYRFLVGSARHISTHRPEGMVQRDRGNQKFQPLECSRSTQATPPVTSSCITPACASGLKYILYTTTTGTEVPWTLYTTCK